MNVVALTIAIAAAGVAPQERPPPNKPSEQFTVVVEAAEDAIVARDVPLQEVVQEVASKLKKRKRWLVVTTNRERAEGVVRILGHWVREEHVTDLSYRVRDRGVRAGDEVAPIEQIEVNYLSRRHYLSASLTILGLRREITGHDPRRKSASLDRAASDLAENLEEFLQASYWDLAERRRLVASTGGDPFALEGRTLAPPEPTPAVDPLFTRYQSSLESYQRGDFLRAAKEVSPLTSRQIYDLSTAFLSGERSSLELKAASLLHTECVVSLPAESRDVLALARRTSAHLETARRYAEAIPDRAERASFVKRWHLTTAYYFHRDLRSTEAISLLATALQLFPGDSDILYALGAFLETSGTLQGDQSDLYEADAIYRLLDSSSVRPSDLDLRFAHVLLLLGKTEEAERRLEEWPSSEENSLAAWMLRGQIASGRDRWAEAREAFVMASEIDPTCQACTVALALAYQRSGQSKSAMLLVAGRLSKPVPPTHDGLDGLDEWWSFLLGPAAEFQSELLKLRSEAMSR